MFLLLDLAAAVFESEVLLAGDLAVLLDLAVVLSDFACFVVLSVLSVLAVLAALSSLLPTGVAVLLAADWVRAALFLPVGLSAVSATLTGVFSLSSVNDEAAGVDSVALSLSTSSG